MFKEFNYLKLLISFGLVFFFYHLVSWELFKLLIGNNFYTFALQIFIFIVIFSWFFNKKVSALSSFIIPLLLGSLLYFITVIEFTDRSLTVEMLILQKNNGNLTLEEYNTKTNLENYIPKRLIEQLNNNYLSFDGSQYFLTDKGRLASNIYYFFKSFYN